MTRVLVAIIIFVAQWTVDVAFADTTRTDSSQIIRNVTIVNGDVIPPWSDEAHDENAVAQFGYRSANFLHITTREHVIARELLFASGDTLRDLDVIETERNLRGYDFLNEANVEVTNVEAGQADVLVRTSDNFSLAPGTILERGGGQTQYGFIVTETNLFGLGKRLAGQYLRETGVVSSTTWLLEYKDPRVLGTRWRLHALGAEVTTGTQFTMLMERPYYRLTTPWAGGWSVATSDGVLRIYDVDASSVAGTINSTAEISRKSTVAGAWYSRGWGPAVLRTKLRGTVRWWDTVYPDAPHRFFATNDRQSVEVYLTASRDRLYGFRRMDFLDDFNIVEDVKTGWQAGLTGGAGFPRESAKPPYAVTGAFAQFAQIFGADDDHVFATETSVSLHSGEDRGSGRTAWSNLITDAWAHWYWQGMPSQTLAASVNWFAGWRPYKPFQLVLGGQTGLRGYEAYRFAGTRRLLANVEDRIYTNWRVFTFAIGMVAFADAGYVWRDGDKVSLSDLRSDVGVGLRIGNTRASTSRISRLDFAFAMRGEQRWSIAFGSEQMFDLFNRRPTPTR
jgi:hypothetical protein